MKMAASGWSILLGVLLVHGMQAQTPAEVFGSVSVRTDVDSAMILVDGSLIGRTPLPAFQLSEGSHHVRILHPDLENWLSPVIEDSVHVVSGDELLLEYRLTTNRFIRSEPSGAQVYSGDKLLGTTPLFVEEIGGDSVFSLRLKGHTEASLRWGEGARGVLFARMERVSGDDARQEVIRDSGGPETLPLVLTATSSILAGGFSAYFKVKADGRYAEYLATGDPAKRAETRRLDSIAGISLAASQVYLALFIYLLVSS